VNLYDSIFRRHKSVYNVGHWRLIPVIIDAWEAEIERIEV
jgi:hypothetical protein